MGIGGRRATVGGGREHCMLLSYISPSAASVSGEMERLHFAYVTTYHPLQFTVFVFIALNLSQMAAMSSTITYSARIHILVLPCSLLFV